MYMSLLGNSFFIIVTLRKGDRLCWCCTATKTDFTIIKYTEVFFHHRYINDNIIYYPQHQNNHNNCNNHSHNHHQPKLYNNNIVGMIMIVTSTVNNTCWSMYKDGNQCLFVIIKSTFGTNWEFYLLLPPFLFWGWLRGGVIGLPEFNPPYWYFAFFSAGFKIWKEHMSVSSTLIIPPALSNSPQ